MKTMDSDSIVNNNNSQRLQLSKKKLTYSRAVFLNLGLTASNEKLKQYFSIGV